MRTSEWIQVGFALVLAVAAWFCPLPLRRRWQIAFFAVFAVVAVVFVRSLTLVLTPSQVSAIRDWLPVALMLVPYWQTGRFFLKSNERLQDWLEELDRRWLARLSPSVARMGRPSRLFMELAYLSCYAIVPAGLGALHLAGMRACTGTYWFVVLVSTYTCYAITPFFPALPPRSIAGDRVIAPASNKGRVVNLWLLQRGSIQAISFPSAHVASTLSASLVLLRFLPVAGAFFLAISLSIAVAAVVDRYHYALDVLLGAAVALAVFLIWTAHLIPSSLIATPAMALTAGL
jgi:membrane-associated phospholipid phosphatase